LSETALVTYTDDQDPELWLNIAYDMATKEPSRDVDEEGKPVREPTTGWLVREYKLTPKQALNILTHPKFTEFIHNMQVAIARVNFDRKAFDALDDIMEVGSNKERISAIKVAAELLGYRQSGATLSVNFNFDQAIRSADAGEVIDVEAYPGL
jgi:hypothetical protein